MTDIKAHSKGVIRSIYTGGSYYRWLGSTCPAVDKKELYDITASWKRYLPFSQGDIVRGLYVVDIFSTAPLKRSTKANNYSEQQTLSNIYISGFQIKSCDKNPYPVRRKDKSPCTSVRNCYLTNMFYVVCIDDIDLDNDTSTCVMFVHNDHPVPLTLAWIRSKYLTVEEQDVKKGIHLISYMEIPDTEGSHNLLPVCDLGFCEMFYTWDRMDPFDNVSLFIKMNIYDQVMEKWGKGRVYRARSSTSNIYRQAWEKLYLMIIGRKGKRVAIEDITDTMRDELELDKDKIVPLVNILSLLLEPMWKGTYNYFNPAYIYYYVKHIGLWIKTNGLQMLNFIPFKGLDSGGRDEDGNLFNLYSSDKHLLHLRSLIISHDMEENTTEKEDKSKDLLKVYDSDEDDAELDEILPGEKKTKQGYLVDDFIEDSSDDSSIGGVEGIVNSYSDEDDDESIGSLDSESTTDISESEDEGGEEEEEDASGDDDEEGGDTGEDGPPRKKRLIEKADDHGGEVVLGNVDLHVPRSDVVTHGDNEAPILSVDKNDITIPLPVDPFNDALGEVDAWNFNFD